MSNAELFIQFWLKILTTFAPALIVIGMTILGVRFQRWAERGRYSRERRLRGYGPKQQPSRLVGHSHYSTNQPTDEDRRDA